MRISSRPSSNNAWRPDTKLSEEALGDSRGQPHDHSPGAVTPGSRRRGVAAAQPRCRGGEPECRRGSPGIHGPAPGGKGDHQELAVQHATAEQLAELRQMVSDERDSFSRGDRGAGIRLPGRVPPQAGRSGEERPADQLPAQPGVPDVADHRPSTKAAIVPTVPMTNTPS